MTSILIDNEWPASLSLPYIDYSGIFRTTTLVSGTDAGRIMRRSRTYKNYGRLMAEFRFGTTEKRAFESFFLDDLGNGAALFTIDLRLHKNSALTNWVVRFPEQYDIAYQEGVWIVTAPLELFHPTVLDATPDHIFLVMGSDSNGDTFLVVGVDSNGDEFLVEE